MTIERDARFRSLLSLPEHIYASEVLAWSSSLRALWISNYGRFPSGLETDLELCRTWFDPVAQGHRLRRALIALDDLPESWDDPGTPLTLRVEERKWLITPEGRCVLDLLEGLPNRSGHVPNEGALMEYDRLLAHLYQSWSRHRIDSVVSLLNGTTKPLQVPAAGVVIALLVNRCTSRERGLTRYAAGEERAAVDRAFFAPVSAFASVLAPSARGGSDPKLVSGWMLYEARRRLGDGLVIDDARAGRDGLVWVRNEDVPKVIEIVSRDLCRGRRSKANPGVFSRAFDALVESLREELPALAGFGLVHERPAYTREIRAEFLRAVAHFAEVP